MVSMVTLNVVDPSSSPGRVKPKTVELVFVAFQLSTQQ
jgi:hypothetical protein